MGDVMWMFANSPDKDADMKMIMELRNDITEEIKLVERILSAEAGSELFQTQSRKLRSGLNLAKATRQEVALTLGVLMTSDSFLNPNPKSPNPGDAMRDCLRFLGSELGVTKADIGHISASKLEIGPLRFFWGACGWVMWLFVIMLGSVI